MGPADVTELLTRLRSTRRPVWLHGKPGVGKSSLARQAADSANINFLDVRSLLHDPTDFKFPLVDPVNRKVTWIQSIFPTDPSWEGIVCLEELDKAPPLVQAALLQATLEHECGGEPLPEGMWFIACGNNQTDRAGSTRTITPLLNRFVHIDLEVSNDDWQAWAITHDIIPEVRAFLRWRPGLLMAFDPAKNDRAFPSPRSWQFVSQMFHAVQGTTLLFATTAGAVGDGAAAEFTAFVEIYQSLPDLEVVFNNPKGVTIPKEPSVLWALIGAITSKARAQPKLAIPATQVAIRFPKEFSVMAVRDLIAACGNQVLAAPGVSDWLKTNQDLLIQR